jgi:hypothetical protein
VRTLTAAQSRVLSGQNRSTHLRIEVNRGGAGLVDLTDLEGRDWVESFDYGGGVDVRAVTGTVRLHRQSNNLNLAPLVDGSKLNSGGTLIDVGHELVAKTAAIAQDAVPVDADFVEVFRGEIDRTDFAASPMQLKVTDLGGLLVRRFIEKQIAYGSALGTKVEEVMQDILDDHNVENQVTIAADYTWDATTTVTTSDTSEIVSGDFVGLISDGAAPYFEVDVITAGVSFTIKNPASRTIPSGGGDGATLKIPNAKRVTLFSENGSAATPFNPSDSPGFLLLPYAQSKETVMRALETLAQQIGWLVKYQFHDNTSQFQLQLFAPERAVAAQGTLSLTGLPSDAETFQINTTVMTARSAGPLTANEFLIGADAATTAKNIVTALTTTSTEKDNLTAFTGASVPTDVVIAWGAIGVGGNAVVFTEALSNATADGAGTLGGTIAGSDGKTTPDFTFNEDIITNYQQLAVDRQDVRNAMRLAFTAATGTRFELFRKDQASIDKFGRLYMEIAEAGSSQIDTFEEAAAFLDAAMADLREPDAEQAVEVLYFWPVEDTDLFRFLANGDHYDADQDLAIVTWRHVLKRKRNRTVLTTRGKPSGGRRRWLEIEGRPGVAAPLDLRQDNAPEGGASQPGVGTIIITYDDPKTMSPAIFDWATSRIHVVPDTDPGFPDFTVADANLAAIGRQTRFEIDGLIPGTTYAAKIVIVDGVGNESVVSGAIQQATEKVGPFHENEDREFGTINQNPNFTVFTKGTAVPPDAWQTVAPVATNGDWADTTGNWFTSVVAQNTGARSLKLNTVDLTGAPQQLIRQFRSDFFLVEAGLLYIMDFSWRHDGSGVQNDSVTTSGSDVPQPTWASMQMAFEFYDKDKALISTLTLDQDPGAGNTLFDYGGLGGIVNILTGGVPANTWFQDRGWRTAPATAVYARALIKSDVDGAIGTGDWGDDGRSSVLFIDNVRVARSMARLDVVGAATQSVAPGVWVEPSFSILSTPILDNTGDFASLPPGPPPDHSYTIPFDGEYLIVAGAELDSLAVSKQFAIRIRKDAAVFVVGTPYHEGGSGLGGPFAYVTSGVVRLSAGNVIDVEIRHNGGGAATLQTGYFLRVTQLSNRN